jgi:hypothetical protein
MRCSLGINDTIFVKEIFGDSFENNYPEPGKNSRFPVEPEVGILNLYGGSTGAGFIHFEPTHSPSAIEMTIFNRVYVASSADC